MTITSFEEYQKVCNACDSKRFGIRARGDLCVASRCAKCFDVCPGCEGEGFEYFEDDRGYTYVRPCPVCGGLDRRIELFNAARLPRRYADNSTFAAFKYQDERGKNIGNLHQVHLKLYRFATGFTPGDQGFLLWGDVGTGKTHLLATVIRELTIEKGIGARFVEFTHLLSEIREGFDQKRGEGAVLGPVIDVPVLAIDELGKGRNNEWQSSIIDEIISKRYNRGLTTLFTTNYPVDSPRLAQDATRADMRRTVTLETLQERVGDRIFSRLYEMADFVQLDAPDYRKS